MAQNNHKEPTPELAQSVLSLESQIEGLLFVADGPTPISQIGIALGVTPKRIRAALDNLEEEYQNRGLRLQRHKDEVQLTTAPEMSAFVETFLGLESLQRLTKSALEVLAIIAYQQPVTRPQIDTVRGVNSDSVIKRLHSRGLIAEVGRTDGPGRPILYGTTPEFMQHFGLNSLKELPPLEGDGEEDEGSSQEDLIAED